MTICRMSFGLGLVLLATTLPLVWSGVSCPAGQADDGAGNCVIVCTIFTVTHGTVTLSGSTANVACDSVYTNSGGSSSTCQADTSWNPAENTLTCDLECSTFTVTDGTVSISGVKATVACDSGFVNTGGVSETDCQSGGTWLPASNTLTCESGAGLAHVTAATISLVLLVPRLLL